MYYAALRSQSPEPRKQYLVVFTDKASLAAVDADTRGLTKWARDDSSAMYDDVDWDNIGDRCRSKDIACSCVILGSPEAGRSTTAPFGRDGSTVEKLRKMCQASSPEGPDDAWFALPSDSDVYLTEMSVKSTAPPPPPVPAPPEIKPVLPTAASAQPSANGPTEAQIQYQQAQTAAMAVKMAQAAQAQGPNGGPFQALAQLIASGRLDPAVMTQLAGNIRSTDLAVRQRAMAQLSQLMVQAQNKNLGASGATAAGNVKSTNNQAQANGANGSAGTNAPALPAAANPSSTGVAAGTAQIPSGAPPQNISIPNLNPAGMTQQQFVAAMQARQRAVQAHTNQQMSQQQQNQLSQLQAQQGNQQSNTGQNANATQSQNQSQSQNAQATAQTTQQLQSQQQALLFQRQQLLAQQQQQQQQQQQAQQASQQGQQTQQGQQPQPQNPQAPSAPQLRPPAWSGTISWMLKGQERSIIPVQCSVLSQTMNPADLMLQQWPSNLEMSAMTPMNMADLQTYVKAHNAPCVLFSVSPQANPDAKAKMNYLAASLLAKQLAAFIKFGNPGCGILLVSASRGPQTPGNEQNNRLLGVVCLKQPYPALNPAAAAANPSTAQAQVPQQPVTINGSVNNGAFQNVPNISPQFLQNAQLQSQLLANQARPTPAHSRTPSQSQPTQPPARPSTLQQFANQPNLQTLQQLQMRQLAATQQPPRPSNMTLSEAQKNGIIKLLREANINVGETFDPSQIPRETLTQIIQQAKDKTKQNMLQKMQSQANQSTSNPTLGLGGQPNQSLGGLGNLNAQGGGNMNLPAGYNFMNHMNLQNLGSLGGINMAQLAMNQQNQNNANQGGTQPQLNAATLASLGQIPGFNLQQFQAAQAAQAAQNAQNNNNGQGALGLFGQTGLGSLNPTMLNQFQQQH
ncbi:hypothetical protein CC85DRAFT_281716 [Cutaneotrichosporon oleaginosum]|uniref:Mediator of RNA polymerase II transcription subunit 25 n=1 Tax=Cutaneotrichosporon oleaginosum TaxID=879819 RepID=A0A0J1BDD9_9TREE|nr:uncharacterized protein CC85DRAFT_281716 [Cutaneotrichosporon oleaginosum]KLT46079.1 hypothetical protein CC85DRAFT_281716 [Cutaneotrichosporon oleaginosum]TXT10092.1 hypothetical protein COLE_04026 [Cutaneotrichosporon oleaginosum]